MNLWNQRKNIGFWKEYMVWRDMHRKLWFFLLIEKEMEVFKLENFFFQRRDWFFYKINLNVNFLNKQGFYINKILKSKKEYRFLKRVYSLEGRGECKFFLSGFGSEILFVINSYKLYKIQNKLERR